MSKKSVAVEIAGHRYKIRSDSDEDLLRSIAADVDLAMQRVREATSTVDSLDVAVLTCLNLARDLLTLRGDRESSFEEEKMRGLIERVESVLPELPIAANDSGTPNPLSGAAAEALLEKDTLIGTDSLVEADTAKLMGKAMGEAMGEAIGTASAIVPTRSAGSGELPELPSIEILRESAQAVTSTCAADAAHLEASIAETLPEARMAAGGRDRVS